MFADMKNYVTGITLRPRLLAKHSITYMDLEEVLAQLQRVAEKNRAALHHSQSLSSWRTSAPRGDVKRSRNGHAGA